MTSKLLVFQNGKRISPDCVDLEFWNHPAICVFESMRVYDGVIFKLDEHLDRLFESIKGVGIRPKTGRDLFRAQLIEASRSFRYSSAFLRLTVSAGQSWIFAGPLTLPKPSVYKRGAVLRTATTRKAGPRISSVQAKASEYLLSVLAKAESDIGAEVSGEIHETVFLGPTGDVGECRTCNIFMVKRGTLFTPPAYGILDGVTRRTVIELATVSKIPFSERVLSRHDLFNADEAFLTYTSAEILPVSNLDGRKIGSGCPGKITQLLQAKYKKLVKDYIRQNK